MQNWWSRPEQWVDQNQATACALTWHVHKVCSFFIHNMSTQALDILQKLHILAFHVNSNHVNGLAGTRSTRAIPYLFIIDNFKRSSAIRVMNIQLIGRSSAKKGQGRMTSHLFGCVKCSILPSSYRLLLPHRGLSSLYLIQRSSSHHSHIKPFEALPPPYEWVQLYVNRMWGKVCGKREVKEERAFCWRRVELSSNDVAYIQHQRNEKWEKEMSESVDQSSSFFLPVYAFVLLFTFEFTPSIFFFAFWWESSRIVRSMQNATSHFESVLNEETLWNFHLYTGAKHH